MTSVQQYEAKNALSHDAMTGLIKFVGILDKNPDALAAWNDQIQNERPFIEIENDAYGNPIFMLAKEFSAFLGEEAKP